MSASATDLLLEVGTPGTATTLSAPGYTIGGTSINVASTANWPTATGVVFAMDEASTVNGEEVQTPGSYREFIGTVASATSVTNVDCVFGSDRDFDAGATTRVYIPISAERENRIVEWGTAEHNQLGGHEVAINYDPANPTLETQKWTGVSSAVNEFTMANAPTATAPSLLATGGDTNIDAWFGGKGTGVARFYGNHDGYALDSDTWTYVSATSFKISGKDVSSRFPVGTKLRMTNTTVKYFYVTSATFSTDTTVNVTGGVDYTLANTAITLPCYSYSDSPVGFPQWFNFTPPTTTGWAATPTSTGSKFSIRGRMVTFRIYLSGTSNTTGAVVSLPITGATTSQTFYQLIRGIDNGAALSTPTLVELNTGATSATYFPTLGGGNWTASGTKTINGTIHYEI